MTICALILAVLAILAGRSSAIPQLQHIIIIMQENRSFDSYFGTYPGADGIPMRHGHPIICNPDPATHKCDYSYHDRYDRNAGGPHDTPDEIADVDDAKMDGFVIRASGAGPGVAGSRGAGPRINIGREVMGYHDEDEIPNYWAYARNYVLQDHMFSASTSWSYSQHLFLVSNWSASCRMLNRPQSCSSSFGDPDFAPGSFAWTDITWLLHAAGVSWKYYVDTGLSPDVINPGEDDGIHGRYVHQDSTQPSIWNPLPAFSDVIADGQLDNVVNGNIFYSDAAAGTLPAVSWIVANGVYSEHPPESVKLGMQYVTGLVNAVMSGPDWKTSAIFITWDEWGGLFDHIPPPKIDWGGYGIRVPALIISPWTRPGHIDHQLMSFDAYNKLIEDLFLSGQRLDPRTDGRPDPRPDVREAYPRLGNLLNDFDFSQTPGPPLILKNALILR